MSARLQVYHGRLPGLVQTQTRSGRVRIADQIAADAAGAAPYLKGDFRAGIGVETQGDQVLVVNADPTAIHKEFGTSRTPAHATMTSAATKYGIYSGMRPR